MPRNEAGKLSHIIIKKEISLAFCYDNNLSISLASVRSF